jgi:hypothetical protein
MGLTGSQVVLDTYSADEENVLASSQITSS